MHLFIRFAFRITSLALKFALTVVVARMLGFAAVADYGLALAVSVVSSKLLGLGFSTEMNRRLSDVNPGGAIQAARRLLLLYCFVYAVIAVVVLIVHNGAGFDGFRRIPPGVLWGVMLVAFSEHIGLETTSYVFSLHRPRLGALLLFIRTGAWAGVAIPGLLTGMIVSIETIFTLWWGTNLIAALAACWCIWRRGREIRLEQPVSRKVGGVRSVWVAGFPFFVAATVLSGLQYGERFLASSAISADSLGRYVFAWSIANAIQTIAYATIVVTAGPRLVRSLSGTGRDFWATLRISMHSALGITIIAAAAILIAYKPIFHVAREPAGSRELTMLSILLVSFVLRSIADVYWSGAVALRLGKQVAIAMAVVAAIGIPVEWLLVTHLGAMGAALAHLAASTGIVAILVFLVMRVRAATETAPEAAAVNREAIHVS
ncbi:polysaccharide biosynthesis protein [Paraburkholderia caffeinilytica]|uniref:polysaccharide biosynthesis protein n=1 Tax=Paraburkholderia caffeinilytica TaxID=1761016 RepID=UPI003D9FE3E3